MTLLLNILVPIAHRQQPQSGEGVCDGQVGQAKSTADHHAAGVSLPFTDIDCVGQMATPLRFSDIARRAASCALV